MNKYKVQMVNQYSGSVEDECVDEMAFDSEDEAKEYAGYMNSCSAEGAEILQMSNPGDYEEDYGEGENYEYIAVDAD